MLYSKAYKNEFNCGLCKKRQKQLKLTQEEFVVKFTKTKK